MAYIDDHENQFVAVANALWAYAETKFEETKSADFMCHFLEQEGFDVEMGIAGMDTAFVASYGNGTPVVGILCEYDALSGLSQVGGSALEKPLISGGNGHGCGHNLFAGGSIAAAVEIRHQLETSNIPGTVKIYGCPAEEGGSGKVYMSRAGVFDDVDFAFAWHPSTVHTVPSMSTMANCQYLFRFKGKSAHASMSPHLGRSALDAVELMNVGANYLREHVPTNVRISYAITNTGGSSPNVVQANAEVVYLIRAHQIKDVVDVVKRVMDIARGAALMTSTDVDIVFDKACSNLIPNTTLERVLDRTMHSFNTPVYTDAELKLAQEFAQTMPDGAKVNELKFLHGLGEDGKALYDHLMQVDLADRLLPYTPSTYVAPVSTDVGDVSWIVPTAQLYSACWTLGTPGHSWQAVAQGTTSYAHKGMLFAGKVMATAAIEIMQRKALIEEAKAELVQRRMGVDYVCPIPEDVQPPCRR